ncbi:MAG: protein RodZ, contains Xre-like HTH and DUF4115 domains [Candidatus Kentron sp. G]|nr:MAG: protein RodZ, contains Xre-like HTH and DUF4115 domains [Candidatus Kentron sp. G]VFN01644.1 MAG: protein RodZ, contains Xre-like HTH and DUF4115 domains [Candidatus Kentron sp. G]VFN03194.1 MAG: protein RodZ, contains Xre-like HTH and DUF4115 domains [Candidatus Kentron sp. G]
MLDAVIAPRPDGPATPEDEEEKGPGKQLRQARQLHKLTIDDIAVRLRLDPATIRYLEEEDYGKLPEPAFIRGYLRAYARSLGIDPEPILRDFRDYGLTPPSLIRDVTNPPQMGSGHIVVRIGTYLIVFCLIALMFPWRQDRISPDNGATEPRNEELSSEQSPDAKPLPHRETEIVSSSRVLSPPSQQPSETESRAITMRANRKLSNTLGRENGTSQGDAAGVAAPRVADLIEAATEIANSPEPESAGSAPAGDAPVTANPTAGEVPRETSGEAGVLTAQPPEAMARAAVAPRTTPEMDDAEINHLVLHLEEDCWMEIYDGHGEKLYHETGFAGRTYEFHGVTPFRVILGYTRGVKVVYNGKPFDFAPYIQGEFAEFSLGASPPERL